MWHYSNLKIKGLVKKKRKNNSWGKRRGLWQSCRLPGAPRGQRAATPTPLQDLSSPFLQAPAQGQDVSRCFFAAPAPFQLRFQSLRMEQCGGEEEWRWGIQSFWPEFLNRGMYEQWEAQVQASALTYLGKAIFIQPPFLHRQLTELTLMETNVGELTLILIFSAFLQSLGNERGTAWKRRDN